MRQQPKSKSHLVESVEGALERGERLASVDRQGQRICIEPRKDSFLLSWCDEPGICGDAHQVAVAFVALADPRDLQQRLTPAQP